MQLNSGLKAGYANVARRIVVVPQEPESKLPQPVSEDFDSSAAASPGRAATPQYPRGTKLMFPDQQYNDEFLRTMTSVVRWSRRCGALGGGGGRPAACCACAVAALLGVVVAISIQRLLLAVAAWKKDGGAVSSTTSGLLFYLNAVGTVVLTWRLGGAWRLLAARWAAAERSLAAHEPPASPPRTLRRDMRAVVAVVTVGSFVEHAMSLLNAIGVDCPAGERLKCYTLSSHSFLLTPEQYTWVWGVFVLIVSHVATVLWNLQDLVVVLLALGLSERYRRLNAFAASIVDRSEQCSRDGRGSARSGAARPLWRAAREGFARQAALVRHVDDIIGPLVLLSFLNNFYFICLQLFHGIAPMAGVVQRCYFILSLSWLCARTAGVVLVASAVHLHSRAALAHVYTCPSHHYTVEVHRLQTQLSRDEIALTGMRFFEITRSFLLKVTGAIITYEIVLVQFNDSVCSE